MLLAMTEQEEETFVQQLLDASPTKDDILDLDKVPHFGMSDSMIVQSNSFRISSIVVEK